MGSPTSSWDKIPCSCTYGIKSRKDFQVNPMYVHMETGPLTGMLQNVAMREIHMIIQTNISKLCILHMPSFKSSTYKLQCTNSKRSSPLFFMQYPIMPKNACKPSSLNLLQETTWHVGGLTSHPKHTLIFLFNTGTLPTFPFTIIWKCLCIDMPPLFTNHSSNFYFIICEDLNE